jgi:chromosomal replication initiator protein
MHSIGNEILRKNPSMKVLYVTSEKFTNDFVNSIKDKSMEKFKQKYRSIDLLLIDDIQFIAGKAQIQEEFFNTFNSLRDEGKQLVISSDKPPRDIPLLEDRLKSRLEWGIVADIYMADYETRLAILRKKTDEKHAIIDDDILQNIAAKIDSNIRELEGVFNKLVVQASLTHTPVTMEMSEKAINDMIRQKESVISIDYIQDCVCKYFNITDKDLKSTQRSNDITHPRQIGMYLCRILTNESFPKIGDSFGKRDHTTVMHGYKKIEQEIKQIPESNTKLIVESVKKIILAKEN